LRPLREEVLDMEGGPGPALAVMHVVDVRLHQHVAAAAKALLFGVLEDCKIADSQKGEREDAETQKMQPQDVALRLAAAVEDQRREDADEDQGRDADGED